jgi:hypothetical protein
LVAGGALLIALGIAALVFGSNDDEPSAVTTADSPAPTTPAQTNPGPSDQARDKPEGSGKDGGKSPDGDSGSEAPTNGEPAAPSPYGPPGTPAGTVPSGAGASENEEAVVKTLRAFVIAMGRADGPQACAQLSREGRKRVEREIRQAAPETTGTPCEGSIVLYQSTYARETNPKFQDLIVSGTTATATGPPNKDAALTKYGRTWLIDDYGW